MADTRQVVVGRLVDTLRAGRNPDGGWGYSAGNASRLEPTCWALLALLDAPVEPLGRLLMAGLSLIARWQRPDGLLADIPAAPPNLAFNGLAAAVIRRAAARRFVAVAGQERVEARLLEGLCAIKGVRSRLNDYQRQDNGLQAWPWNAATFSWVEPTAFCLLALKKARGAFHGGHVDARITEADRLLIDRCCHVGGWNYGNSNVFGKELHPYVPTTGLGLLAMHDQRGLPAVNRSLGWLKEHQTAESSGMALALALMALRVYREPVDLVESALNACVLSAGFSRNQATTAMSLYALTASQHELAAFEI